LGPRPAELEVEESPSSEHRDAILHRLVQYNHAEGPPTTAAPLAILVHDNSGCIAGGLWAETLFDWLHIKLLVVPHAMRGTGLGSRLMAKAEEVAKGRGCVGVWLDTFSFQAPEFYQKLGYGIVGTIDDHPIGGARHIMSKRLA
jgi:GNAT superfamily N-acetyltransferase